MCLNLWLIKLDSGGMNTLLLFHQARYKRLSLERQGLKKGKLETAIQVRSPGISKTGY